MQRLIFISSLIFIFFSLTISANGLTTAESYKSKFVEGLNHLNNREYKQGIELLEQIFKNGKDPILKAKAAYLLAITKYDKRKGKRSNYGKHAYQHHPYLSLERKIDLAMLTADLFFNEANIEDSIEFYKIVSQYKTAPFKTRELATYKLGWALVNEDKYGEVFKLWNRWIRNNDKGILRENIIHDYAKFYSEHYLLLKTSPYEFSMKYAPKTKEYTYINKGLKAGTTRFLSNDPSVVLERIIKTGHYGPFLTHLLDKSNYFQRRPCKVIPHLSLTQEKGINHKSAINSLNECFFQIEKNLKSKKTFKKKRARKNLKEIAKAYHRYSTIGRPNFIKGKYYFLIKNNKMACQSFLEGLISLDIKKSKIKDLKNALKGVGSTCKKVSKNKDIDPLLFDLFYKYYSSPFIKNLFSNNKSFSKIFLSLVSLPSFIKTSQEGFTLNASQWKEMSVTKQYLAYNKNEPTQLIQFAKNAGIDLGKKEYRPLFYPAIHKLISLKNFSLAYHELTRFTPFKNADMEATKLWFLIGQSDYGKKAQLPSSETLSKTFQKNLKKLKNIGQKDLKFLAHFHIQQNNWKAIFDEWDKFKKLFNKDIDLAQSLIRYISNLNNSSIPKHIQNEKIISYAISITNLGKKNNKITSKVYTPKFLRKNSFGREENLLAYGHRLYLDQKNLNSLLTEKGLLKYLKSTQYALERYKKRSWTIKSYFEATRFYLIKTIDIFSKNVSKSKIQKDKSKKIRQLLKSWRDGL
jgi:hypothetical protein